MKSKVILFCVLLSCSKIVDSIPHSEGHLRQRVNSPSKWQVNQNAQDAQYLNTDFTQTRNINTLSDSAIQQENNQDYYSNQGRYNYNGYGYNKSPVSSPSGKELLDGYNSQVDERRLDSLSSGVEKYPSQVGFDSQPFRNQNWRLQNQYTNPAPSAVLITDSEKPLVNSVQEPYRAPVQYLQNNVPPSNRRLFHTDRSYLKRQQFQHPLADNAGDSKYVANSAPLFGSNSPVPYNSEGQAGASEIKARLTGGQKRYQQNLATQSGNIYHEAPALIATETLTDQSERLSFLDNYKLRSVLSNTASSINYDDGSAVIPEVDNYNLNSRSSNGPLSYESYSGGQTAASELKARLTDGQGYLQNLASQSGNIYHEVPTETLTDQSENVKYLEGYKSRSDLSNIAPSTNYEHGSAVVPEVNNYSLGTRSSNVPVSYQSYSEDKTAESEIKSRLASGQRHTQNFSPNSGTIYDESSAVITTETLRDQSENNKNLKKYRSHSDLSNTVPTTNDDDDFPVVSAADTYSSGSRPSNGPLPYDNYGDGQAATSVVRPRLTGGRRYVQNLAPQSRIYNDFPATDDLEDLSENINYDKRDNYKSRSDSSNNQDNNSPVISAVDNTDSDHKPSWLFPPENIEKKAPVGINKILSDKPLARRYAHNYKSETGSSNIARDNSFNGVPNVISETVEGKFGDYEVNYGTNEPLPINENSGTSPTSTDTALTKGKTNKNEDIKNSNLDDKIKEFNLSDYVLQDFLDGTKKYLVIHPNGTVEYVDSIDLDSHQNSKLRLVNTKLKSVGDAEGDETQSPENIPKNIDKTSVPVNKSSLPADNQQADDKKSTLYNADESDLKLPFEGLPADHSNFKTTHAKQQPDGHKLKPLTPLVNQPADDGSSKPLTPPGDDDKLKLLRPYIRHGAHHYKPKPIDVNQLADDNGSKPLVQAGHQLAVDKKYKPSNKNKSGDDNDSKLSSLDENHPSDVNNAKTFPPNENQSGDDKDQSLSPYKRWLAHHLNSKHSRVNQLTTDRDSNPSSNENQSLDANNFKTLPSNQNQSIADIDSKTLHLHESKPVLHHKSKYLHLNQPQDVINVSSSSPSENKLADYNGFKPLLSHENLSENNGKVNPSSLEEKQPEDVTTSNSSSPDEYQSSGDKKFEPSDNNQSKPMNPRKRLSAHHKEQKFSYGNQSENDRKSPKDKPVDDKKTNSLSPDDNKSLIVDTFPQNNLDADNNDLTSSGENQTEDNDTSPENNPENKNQPKPFNPNKKQPAHHNKSKFSHGKRSENDRYSPKDKQGDNTTSNSSSSNDNHAVNDDNSPQNKQEIDNNFKISYAGKNETEDGKASPNKPKPINHNTPKPSYEDQLENDDTSPQNEPKDDKDSSYSSENQSEDDNKPKLLRPNEKQSKHVLKPTPSISKTDDQPVSTTLSPTAPNYTTSSKSQVKHRHRHTHRKSTTSSPIVSSTTPCPEKASEDQIITLSPIEQLTDNVSDVPPVTTTTTTAKPIDTADKSDTIKDAKNKIKNSANSSSGDLASIKDKVLTSTTPNSSTTSTDKIIDDKTTKGTVENKNTQANDKPVKSQVNNVKNNTQTVQSAVYNSSELLDTNTDVPAKSDDSLPVTTSPSAHYDVNTGDASGDNTLDLEQPETDVIITVSSSTDNNDSEDDIITINIEVSESTGSSSKNKTLLVSIDTNDDSDDDSKTSQLSGLGAQSSDCNKDHIDDGRGKNLEIDMSNLQGEPTIWIRTTNQDFIDKLTDKNDTAFDVVYYFNMVTQPAIEREKVTTIHCNGTVVIETKETTYANKDDPTPTIVKTSHTIQVQDYKLYGLDSFSD